MKSYDHNLHTYTKSISHATSWNTTTTTNSGLDNWKSWNPMTIIYIHVQSQSVMQLVEIPLLLHEIIRDITTI